MSFVYIVLIVVSTIQSYYAVNIRNCLALMMALIALSGSIHYSYLSKSWARWLETLLSYRAALAMPIWLARASICRAQHSESKSKALLGTIMVILPSVLLAIMFVPLLSSGNAVFGDIVSTIWRGAVIVMQNVTLPDASRLFFWFIVFAATLVLLQPLIKADRAKFWARKIPRFRLRERSQARVVFLQTLVSLLTVNLIFFCVNGLDLSHLWFSFSLPQGVSYAEYVHQGTYSLIFAVLLSSVMLALFFQQHLSICRHPLIKLMGLIWVLQNLFLLISVYKRLDLYVDAYWLTPKRIYLFLFLILVACGYALLSWYIASSKNLKWLLQSNGVLVFFFFMVTQFIDGKAIAANYSLSRWAVAPDKHLGEQFYETMHSYAWPYLAAIASKQPESEAGIIAHERLMSEQCYLLERNDFWGSHQQRLFADHAALRSYLAAHKRE